MHNSVTLVGFLGRDPEVRVTANGTAVARFSVATTERFINGKGKKQEDTYWHTIVAWGKQAELVEKYLSKGSRVLVEGKLTYKDWEDKEGNKRTSTEIVLRKIVFLDNKRREAVVSEDDIPF